MKKNETHVSVLTPLLIAMSICFAILKLSDIISMSWWLITAPLILAGGIWLIIILVILIANLIENIKWRRR